MAQLLGQLDSIFWPFSGNAETRCIAATMELRKQWNSGQGLPARTSGTVNERKDTELLWKRLEAAGLITVARSRGRRTHAKLSQPGELAMRAICGTGYPAMYWDEFRALAALFDSTAKSLLPESFTCGAEPWIASDEQQDMLYRQRSHFLPFAVAGFANFSHDCRGCQWLSITDAGRTAIETLDPAWPPDDLDVDDDVCEIYDAAYRAETARLATITPDNEMNLYPPASAGIGWGDFLGCLEFEREQALVRDREASP